MAEIIRMPRMSDTMEEGNIVEWLKQEGDSVEPGDILAEVETDKATMELESYFEGTLLHIGVKEGPVPVDDIIAVIGEEGEDWKSALEEAKDSGSDNGDAQEEEEKEEEATAETATESSSAGSDEGSQTSDSDSRIKASPLARSMAKESGIDLANVQGSGDSGRIVKRDIEAAIEQQEAQPESTPQPAPQQPAQQEAPKEEEQKPAIPSFTYGGDDQYEDENVSQMRKTIARRLSESKFGAPHFYLTVEIDMEKAMQWRKQLNEVAPVKLSYNDIVVKAAASALKMHPAVNSSWLGDKIRKHQNVHIGVAVAVDDGLLVPVIRHADMKTMSQINVEVKELAGKARKRKLQPQEMQGNTFTISNLGMFGIEEFTAIINPPDACILAVGGIIEKPVVKDGEIVPGHRMKVTLSCDHRVVDGATGAQFLNTFKDILENPVRLLV